MRTPGSDKLKELILLLCRESEGDLKFDTTKLGRLLFVADFTAYKRLGKSITGQQYWNTADCDDET